MAYGLKASSCHPLMFGVSDDSLVTFLILCCKFYIYRCKFQEVSPNFVAFKRFLSTKRKTDRGVPIGGWGCDTPHSSLLSAKFAAVGKFKGRGENEKGEERKEGKEKEKRKGKERKENERKKKGKREKGKERKEKENREKEKKKTWEKGNEKERKNERR